MTIEDLGKLNMLAIAFAGAMMCLFGAVLFFYFGKLQGLMVYLLPIPPIVVAAYVFVFNLVRTYAEAFPPKPLQMFTDVALATLVSSSVFLLVAGAILVMTSIASNYLR